MEYKVEGHANLVKNVRTGAVLNTNETEVRVARKRKLLKKKQQEEKELLQQDLETLKGEMAELKTLLKQMVEKDGN